MPTVEEPDGGQALDLASRPNQSATRKPSPADSPGKRKRQQRPRDPPEQDDGLEELRRPAADEPPERARCCSIRGVCASIGAAAGLLLAAVIGSIVYAMFMQAILWQSLTGGKGALDPANWKEELKGSSWLVGEAGRGTLRRVHVPPSRPQATPRSLRAPRRRCARCPRTWAAGAASIASVSRAPELSLLPSCGCSLDSLAGAFSFLLLATSTAAVSAFVLPMEAVSPMAFYSYAFMAVLFVIQLATVRYASMRPGESAS